MIKFPTVFHRDLPAGFDGLFMWDFLDGVFGPSIRPMDFDAVVERRGSFLIFETKAPGTMIPVGQRRTLETVVHDRRFTVLCCAKRPEDVRQWEILCAKGQTTIPGDADALKAWCRCWYEHKNANDPIW
jgi:hypothetical protein